jgi:hypothetical protein
VLDGVAPSVVAMVFASILDSLQDVSSIVIAAAAFLALFLLLEGFDRV